MKKKVVFKCRKGDEVALCFQNRDILEKFIKIVSPQKVEKITIFDGVKITKIIEL